MQFLQTFCTLLVFTGLVFGFWKRTGNIPGLKPFFFTALALKLICGFAIGYFYTAEFDTHRLQQLGSFLTDICKRDPISYWNLVLFDEIPQPEAAVLANSFKIYSNSFFLSKIISLLNFLTGSNYYLNSLFFSFF